MKTSDWSGARDAIKEYVAEQEQHHRKVLGLDELVKAAEKCPARCIHPGKPREGDPTVTDALRVRAAKFD